MHKFESAALVATMLLTGLGAAACERDGARCESPRAESPRYPPAPGATGDRSTWRGIEATTRDIPEDVKAVASYRRLDENTLNVATSEWQPSRPFGDPSDIGRVVLLVGDGPVQFSMHYTAPGGSPACNTPPATQFPSTTVPRQQLGGFAPQWG